MSLAKEMQAQEPEPGFVTQLQRVLKENIRDYGMFIALFVIWAVFGAGALAFFSDLFEVFRNSPNPHQ